MDFLHNPHKNLYISGLVALTILAVGFYVNHKSNNVVVTKIIDGSHHASTTKSLGDLDSDHDGLPEWEESLYGSNAHNPDTDGDGTTDGGEVAEGRSPTKAGPDDKLAVIEDPNFATSSTDTIGIRKDFFAKYLALQSKDIRETTYRDLIKGFNPIKYRPTGQIVDLNISGDNSTEALRAYGNAFGKIIKKYTSVHTNRTEEEIIADGLKAKNDGPLKELQLPSVVYKKFSLDLKALKTPSSLAKSHLLIVNGYDGMSRGLLGMQHLFSDPVDGAGGYQTYTKTRFDVTTGYAQVVSYFRTHAVTFTKDEPGFPFVRKAVPHATSTKSTLLRATSTKAI